MSPFLSPIQRELGSEAGQRLIGLRDLWSTQIGGLRQARGQAVGIVGVLGVARFSTIEKEMEGDSCFKT